jgi:hypothetical protein
MLFNDIYFGSSVQKFLLSYDIDETIILENQLENLTEDILQVQFSNSLTLDIGWYPSFDQNGEFIVYLTQYGIWDTPIIKETTKSIADLKRIIEIIVQRINDMI